MKSFDDLSKYNGLSLLKWGDDIYASENTRLAFDFYKAGQQSRQAEIDELKKRIDNIQHSLIDHLDCEYDDLDRPSYDAMLYAIREIKEILEGKSE